MPAATAHPLTLDLRLVRPGALLDAVVRKRGQFRRAIVAVGSRGGDAAAASSAAQASTPLVLEELPCVLLDGIDAMTDEAWRLLGAESPALPARPLPEVAAAPGLPIRREAPARWRIGAARGLAIAAAGVAALIAAILIAPPVGHGAAAPAAAPAAVPAVAPSAFPQVVAVRPTTTRPRKPSRAPAPRPQPKPVARPTAPLRASASRGTVVSSAQPAPARATPTAAPAAGAPAVDPDAVPLAAGPGEIPPSGLP